MLFYIWEDARAQLPGVIPFIYIPAIWSQYPVSLLSAYRREWLQPDGCRPAGIALLSGCSEGLVLLMTVASLFTDIAGNTPHLKGEETLVQRR